jgi:hypothetical protein
MGSAPDDRHPTQEISRRPNCVLSLKLDSFSGIVKIVTGNSTDSVDDLPELEANCGVNLATFLRCDVETLDGRPSLPPRGSLAASSPGYHLREFKFNTPRSVPSVWTYIRVTLTRPRAVLVGCKDRVTGRLRRETR